MRSTAVLVGPDEGGLGAELANDGFEVTRVEEVPTSDSLDEAGMAEADLFVLTDVGEASAIPVARELNPDVRVVVYCEGSIPEFARGQTDLAVDPELLDAPAVAEELGR